jgi:hypothetical protein
MDGLLPEHDLSEGGNPSVSRQLEKGAMIIMKAAEAVRAVLQYFFSLPTARSEPDSKLPPTAAVRQMAAVRYCWTGRRGRGDAMNWFVFALL